MGWMPPRRFEQHDAQLPSTTFGFAKVIAVIGSEQARRATSCAMSAPPPLMKASTCASATLLTITATQTAAAAGDR